MASSVEALIDLLDLAQQGPDSFVGKSPQTQLQRVFGGQVAAQSLMAAGRTVPSDRAVHSLHAYFLRPGEVAEPIHYSVERPREGRAFNTRRVVASQEDRVIFVMSANFQVTEPGFSHQDPAPVVPNPELLMSAARRAELDPGGFGALWPEWASMEVRAVPGPEIGPSHPVRSQIWLRTAEALPDDPLLHACVSAYASDLTLLQVAMLPHEVPSSEVQMASLDHAMWFHRRVRADEWLLYDQMSPWAGGGRGLAAGRLFDRDGSLVVSVMQEGLIRPKVKRR